MERVIDLFLQAHWGAILEFGAEVGGFDPVGATIELSKCVR